MLTFLFIVLGLILLVALPILINLDWGGSGWNTFNDKLTQTEKREEANKLKIWDEK